LDLGRCIITSKCMCQIECLSGSTDSDLLATKRSKRTQVWKTRYKFCEIKYIKITSCRHKMTCYEFLSSNVAKKQVRGPPPVKHSTIKNLSIQSSDHKSPFGAWELAGDAIGSDENNRKIMDPIENNTNEYSHCDFMLLSAHH
jgi:hypothetical protein